MPREHTYTSHKELTKLEWLAHVNASDKLSFKMWHQSDKHYSAFVSWFVKYTALPEKKQKGIDKYKLNSAL